MCASGSMPLASRASDMVPRSILRTPDATNRADASAAAGYLVCGT